MKSHAPDTAGRMFQALGKMQININDSIQGASERKISLVIDGHQRTRALNLIHQAFFSKIKSLSLILIGAGRIGSGLLQQLAQQQKMLLEKKINISVCAVTNSKKMLINQHGIKLAGWQNSLLASDEAYDIATLLKSIPTIENNNIALVDCTASDTVVDAYPLFIKEGETEPSEILLFPGFTSLAFGKALTSLFLIPLLALSAIIIIFLP